MGGAVNALSCGGLWKFLKRYPSMAWYELHRSFSRAIFCQSLQRLVREIRLTISRPATAACAHR